MMKLTSSLRGGRRRSETCEKRGQSGSTDKPRMVSWAQAAIPDWTVYSRVAAAGQSAAQAPEARGARHARGWPRPSLLLVLALCIPVPGAAALADLASVPMAAASPSSVKPNILFIMDDSGSMSWTYMPDAAGDFRGAYGYASSQCNSAYYNPTVTYLPPLDAGGASYPNARFNAAYSDGFDASSPVVDLGSRFVVNRFVPEAANGWYASYGSYTRYSYGATAAYYYDYSGSQTARTYNDTRSAFYKECATAINADDRVNGVRVRTLFTLKTVGATSGPGNTDERQNFANWYSYYRTRMLAMKTAATRAFAAVSGNYRVGYLSINNNTGADFLNLGDFSGSQKQSWFARVGAAVPYSGTPLRSALSTAGLIYGGRMNGESLNGSRVTDPIQYSCQQNFAILSTDGYWNTGNDSGCSGQGGSGCMLDRRSDVGDQDGASTVPRPLQDSLKKANTLADVAMYYYTQDLRTPALQNCTGALGAGAAPVCADNVPGTGADTAAQQHMTTFTLGLGVNGTLQYSEDYLSGGSSDFNGLVQGTRRWPDPVADEGPARIDDLWHAAVNGRGSYFNAASPESLYLGLRKALAGVSARTGASSAAATSNLEPVSGDNFVYSALYRTVSWDGDLQARTINAATGAVAATPLWSAQALLDGNVSAFADARTIHTFDAGSATRLKPFTWDRLSGAEREHFSNLCAAGKLSQCATLGSDERAALSGANLVAFLRGQKGRENIASNESRLYRSREHALGDIVGSQPVYVKAPPFAYADDNYATFRADNRNRAATVYVGANDGMLHAFDGDTGRERWAYVPPMALPSLYRLADQNYSANHAYFVDGSPTVGDICPNAPASACAAGEWKSILVGGMNSGGRGYYALDVTDPANPRALWNYSVANDQNLGLTFGNPVITKRRNGTWVVVFTSGYNNVSPGDGRGYLYVLNAHTGELLKKLATGAGDTATPSNLARINAWVPTTTSNSADRFYGGDMLGKVWRFDIDDTTPPAGSEAFLLAELGLVNGAGIQPVTTRPELAEVAVGGLRYMIVNVGTGRYLGESDLADTSVQSIYALRDTLSDAGLGLVRSGGKLLNRTARASADGSTRTVANASAALDWSVKSGWYMDLLTPGERVSVDMQQQLGLLTVAGNVPSNDACTLGGYAWLYNLDNRTGSFAKGAVNEAVGVRLGSNALAAGVRVTRLTTGKTVTVVTDTGGGISTVDNPGTGAGNRVARRVSWRELTD